MQIEHKQTEHKGVFFVQPEGEEVLAELTYIRQGDDTIVVEHTQVDEELRGENIGYQLVNAVVTYARTHHLKIIPVCTFTSSVIRRKPEMQDVLATPE